MIREKGDCTCLHSKSRKKSEGKIGQRESKNWKGDKEFDRASCNILLKTINAMNGLVSHRTRLFVCLHTATKFIHMILTNIFANTHMSS